MCPFCNDGNHFITRIDRIEIQLNSIHNRIEDIENKAITKPDCNPSEVGLNLVPSIGSFEWAWMQMKRGKTVARYSLKEFIYYLTDFESLMKIEITESQMHEKKLDHPDFDLEDLKATDWMIV